MPIPFMAAASVVSTVWRAIPRPAKIAMGGALAIFLAYQAGHWRGDNHRNDIWVAKVAAEKKAQDEVIRNTTNKAIAEVVRLSTELEKANALNVELEDEAAKDANANRPAVSIDGVRRINRNRPNGSPR